MVATLIFGLGSDVVRDWGLVTLVSGLAILLTDLHASFTFVLETRGLLVTAKLLLVGLTILWPAAGLVFMLLAFTLGSVGSHMPGKYRHRVWFQPQRFIADGRKG